MTGCSIWLDGIRRLPFCENSSMLRTKMEDGQWDPPLSMVPACPCQKSCKPAMDLLACVTSPIRRRTSGSLRAWRCLGRKKKPCPFGKHRGVALVHNLSLDLRVQLIYHGLSHYWSTNQWQKDINEPKAGSRLNITVESTGLPSAPFGLITEAPVFIYCSTQLPNKNVSLSKFQQP